MKGSDEDGLAWISAAENAGTASPDCASAKLECRNARHAIALNLSFIFELLLAVRWKPTPPSDRTDVRKDLTTAPRKR
jgi:hypothetical protein